MLNMYSVFDKKATAYAPPFAAMNDIGACRIVHMAATDASSVLCQFPADFALYYVGVFCDEQGIFLEATQPRFLAEVTQLLKQSPRKETVQ